MSSPSIFSGSTARSETGRTAEDDLRTFLLDQLAAFKVPQEFIFVDELPSAGRGTSTGLHGSISQTREGEELT
jgi:acyl-CoA synthetase (AMP-forming)/AMP-acid ligase II